MLQSSPPTDSSAAPPPDDLTLCWAKLARDGTGGYHPLLFHMIDVAEVARALWHTVLAPATRERLARTLDVPAADAGRWLACWAGLHDLGKASPIFQFRAGVPAALADRLVAARLARYTGQSRAVIPHGAITALVLPRLLRDELGFAPPAARDIAATIGGHHGVFASIQQPHDRAQTGGTSWEEWRARLIGAFVLLLDVPAAPSFEPLPNAFLTWLAGFVSVADWLGSDQDHFPLAAPDPARPPMISPAAYQTLARHHAAAVLRHRGWRHWPLHDAPRTFADLFPGIPNAAPNPVQRAAIDLGARLSSPALVVIEAPMGDGKTEAALSLVDAWSATLGRPGAYLALPTQATSNQMLTRLKAFLESRYPKQTVNLQLLHGHASLAAEFAKLPAGVDFLAAPREVFTADGDGGASNPAAAAIVAAEWFTYRKRGLLAPFGVGTIDQALLAVLQTRHWFVRLFGLAGRVVILDEVHAYDAYMSTLMERLLTWLAALGSPVVLLSATLPAGRRRQLIAAYAAGLGQPAPDPPAVPYPRLSWVSRHEAGAETVAVSARATKTVHLEWLDNPLADDGANVATLAGRLQTALRDGGRVALICNTVARAQRLYAALRPFFPGLSSDGEPELDLLHARFLYMDREAREQRTLRRFGKTAAGEASQRPHRALLVATQIIEQSLDLDFDLIVSDLAPIDVLIQRLGRLHRHPRPDRPPAFLPPRLWVLQPAIASGGEAIVDRGTDHVYDQHLLLRTWLELQSRPHIQVPADIEHLIYAVYDTDQNHRRHPLDPALAARWDATRQSLQQRLAHDQSLAKMHLVQAPSGPGKVYDARNLQLAEDDPDLHPTLQALTRLGDPTVSVICLPAEEAATLRRSAVPDREQAKDLLRHSVSLSRRGVVSAIIAHAARPSGWAKSALLRHHRLLVLDAAGGAVVGPYRIEVDSALGITIHDTSG